jgi:probable rRNA maturation factor
MAIRVQNRHRTIRIDARRLSRLARIALESLGLAGVECGVLLVDDRRMACLNGRYRGQPRPTDVLAFGMREGRFGRMAGDLLGDVVISLDTAVRQARARQARLDAEVGWLLLHGLLHLAGYDHRTAAQRRRMVARQRALARQVSAARRRQEAQGKRQER